MSGMRMRGLASAGTARRVAGRVGDAALWLLAAAGAACIVLAVLAPALGLSIMLFKTGSMGPTIPAGSVAIVQRTPASEIAVGDVVTVDRPGLLPVTHRVTSIETGPGASRTITMRGDANEADDPHPYEVESVRVVRWSAPGLAPVLAKLGDPTVLAGLTLGAALLVGWSFWPREPGERAQAARAKVA